MASWLKEVEKHSGEDVTVMILANKSDIAEEAEVTDTEIKQFEEEFQLKVIKTSAKSGLNVDESFLEMTKKLIVKKNKSGTGDNKKTLGLKKLREGLDGANGGPSSGNGCC